MRNLPVLILAIMLFCAGCSGPKSYLDPDDRSFTIGVPPGWKTETDPEMALVAVSPIQGPNDIYTEALVVGVEVMPVSVSLKRYWKLSKKQLLEDNGGGYIMNEGDTALGDRPAKWMEYSVVESGIDVIGLVYVVVKDRKAYVIIFASQRNDYNYWKPKFELIAQTFRV
jgi:hypothetical protein